MATAEGEILVAIFPVYLNALTGHGVHVVTVNDFLARRDATWMGEFYEFLGLTIGFIQYEMERSSGRRRDAKPVQVTSPQGRVKNGTRKAVR